MQDFYTTPNARHELQVRPGKPPRRVSIETVALLLTYATAAVVLFLTF